MCPHVTYFTSLTATSHACRCCKIFLHTVLTSVADAQVWSTLKELCMYAVQYGNRLGFLTTGKELLCCGFSAIDPPGVRDRRLSDTTSWQ